MVVWCLRDSWTILLAFSFIDCPSDIMACWRLPSSLVKDQDDSELSKEVDYSAGGLNGDHSFWADCACIWDHVLAVSDVQQNTTCEVKKET